MDWYGFPFTRVQVDRRAAYEETFFWNDTPVTPFWSPGHAGAHAGYAIPWHGELTVCTGDTLQYGGGPIGHNLPITYNDNPWPEHAAAITLRRLLALHPALILGGHSHTFRDPDGDILHELLEVEEEAMALAVALLADGDLSRATTPPGYVEIRPARK